MKAEGLIEQQRQLLRSEAFGVCQNRAGIRRETALRLEDAFLGLTAEIKPNLSIEIGAHEASFSTRVISMLPGTRCLAFEANPYVYNRYQGRLPSSIEYKNVAISQAQQGNVTLHIPVGRWDRHYSRANAIGSLLPRKHDSFRYEQVTVPSSTLDSYLRDAANLASVLWVDVEGAQLEVLRSATQTLSACRALYIELETNEVWAGQPLDTTVSDWLDDFGFVEVMRDAIARIQFNAVFIKRELLCEKGLVSIVRNYTGSLRELSG